MSIRVEVKGQTLEFPDGTSDELIDRVVKRDFFSAPKEAAPKTEPVAQLTTAQATDRSLTDVLFEPVVKLGPDLITKKPKDYVGYRPIGFKGSSGLGWTPETEYEYARKNQLLNIAKQSAESMIASPGGLAATVVGTAIPPVGLALGAGFLSKIAGETLGGMSVTPPAAETEEERGIRHAGIIGAGAMTGLGALAGPKAFRDIRTPIVRALIKKAERAAPAASAAPEPPGQLTPEQIEDAWKEVQQSSQQPIPPPTVEPTKPLSKGVEDATIRERSAEAVPVGTPPGDSEALGARVPEKEEVAIPKAEEGKEIVPKSLERARIESQIEQGEAILKEIEPQLKAAELATTGKTAEAISEKVKQDAIQNANSAIDNLEKSIDAGETGEELAKKSEDVQKAMTEVSATSQRIPEIPESAIARLKNKVKQVIPAKETLYQQRELSYSEPAAEITSIADKLRKVIPVPHVKLATVLDSIAAFLKGHGKIYLLPEIADRLKSGLTEDELAFIIAHESIHSNLPHAKDVRVNEIEANIKAADALKKAGYNPLAGASVLRKAMDLKKKAVEWGAITQGQEDKILDSAHNYGEDAATIEKLYSQESAKPVESPAAPVPPATAPAPEPVKRATPVPKRIQVFTKEGVSPENAEALLTGKKTPEQVIAEGGFPAIFNSDYQRLNRLKMLVNKAQSMPEPKPGAAQLKKIQAQQRPPDLVDYIIANYGKIKSKSASKPGEEGYYGSVYGDLSKTTVGRQLLDKSGSSWDEVVDNLRREKILPENATVDDLQEALMRVQANRSKYFAGETPEQQQDAFWEAQKKVEKSGKAQSITVGDLKVGDNFTLKGEVLEVVSIDPDTGEVTTKDGKKFGYQTIPESAEITIDSGSLESKGGAEWPEPEKPKEEPFKLLPPESPAEQKARLAKEAAKKESIEKAAQPLIGKSVDTTGDMFDQYHAEAGLFAAPTPKPTPAAETKSGIVAGTEAEAAALKRMRERLGGASANPFADPRLLTDTVIIGAGIIERGVRAFAEWSKEMLKHDPNLAPHLADLWKLSQRYWQTYLQKAMPAAGMGMGATQPPKSTTPPTAPGAIPAPSSAPTTTATTAATGAAPTAAAIGVAPTSQWYRSFGHQVDRYLVGMGQLYKRRWDEAWTKIPQMLDAADTLSKVAGQKARNMLELRYSPAELDALTFAAQAMGEKGGQYPPNILSRYEQQILNAPKDYPPDLIERALNAVRYAKAHLGDPNFVDGVNRIRQRFDEQFKRERRHGVKTDYWPGYVPQRWDLDLMLGPGDPIVLGWGRAYSGGTGASFKKARTVPDFASGIEMGLPFKTINAAELLEHRISAGERLVNTRDWYNTWRKQNDPVDGLPIVRSLVPKKTIKGTTEWVSPPGYTTFTPPGNARGFAVHDGWSDMFKRLTQPSALESSVTGSLALTAAAALKHKLLLVDTYHLFRLLYSELAATPGQLKELLKPGQGSIKQLYHKGVSALEYRPEDLDLAQSKGLLTPEEVAWIRAAQPDVEMLLKSGLNAGRFSAAMYDRLKPTGIFRGINRYIFEKFSRGAMIQTALSEFDRLKAANPTVSPDKIAKQVSRDVNVIFGNIQRQGWIQSQTIRDLLHAVFLAPQWNEALIRRDSLGALQLAGLAPKGMAKGGVAQGGTLGKTLATGIIAHVILNQILNMVTRGKPTWENTEPGQKLSAWLPDLTGNSPGYFFSPFAIFGEATGELYRLNHEKGGPVEGAIQYVENKFGPLGRAMFTFATGRDYNGLARSPTSWAKKVANALIPVPIGASGVMQDRPGATQKQAMSMFGLRTAYAPTALQEIRTRVVEWKRSTGDKKAAEVIPFEDNPVRNMRMALEKKNLKDFTAAYDEALQQKKPSQVQQSIKNWATSPFTGSHSKETRFKKSLTPDQQARYKEAIQERKELYKRFLEYRRQTLPEKRP